MPSPFSVADCRGIHVPRVAPSEALSCHHIPRLSSRSLRCFCRVFLVSSGVLERPRRLMLGQCQDVEANLFRRRFEQGSENICQAIRAAGSVEKDVWEIRMVLQTLQ